MLRLILIGVLLIVIARIFWRLVDGIIEGASGQQRRQVRSRVKLQRDPVCGTFVAPGAALTTTAAGTTLYFCSEKCRSAWSGR